jgi:hypothetical protein
MSVPSGSVCAVAGVAGEETSPFAVSARVELQAVASVLVTRASPIRL